ncbi:MAG: 4'-phosphopantetheinyl transferase family protein [Gemmatimonadaceae bacterium]
MSPLIELAPDVVDIWTAPLDVDDATLDDLLHRLSPSERKRVGALLEEKAARQYVVSRAMQRQLLASYVGGSPADIQFGIVAMGKPTLSKPNDIGLQFNTTHSGRLVIIAVTAMRDVGVDVEQMRPIPRAMAVAKRCYSRAEHDSLLDLAGEARDRAFLAIWVKREGTAKARGDSVWRGLASWKNGELEPLAREFTVKSLDLGPEFVGVVAARGNDWGVAMRGTPVDFTA